MPAIDGQLISGCCCRCSSAIRWVDSQSTWRLRTIACQSVRVRHTSAEISQWHGFAQNGVTDQRAQRASNHHLYTLAQESLEVGDQAPRKPWPGVTGHVDKEVDIAFRRVFPASHGAEKQDIARAVEGGHPQDFVAMFFHALTGAHEFIVLSGRPRG